MKIIAIKGGLGNQLFQYAFGRYLSVNLKEEVKIDNGVSSHKQDTYRKYTLDKFNIALPLATREEVKKYKYPLHFISRIWRGAKARIFKIYNIGWDGEIINTKSSYLEGYWQSYKYLEPVKDILLKEITLKNPLTKESVIWQTKINNTRNSVSVHIRRGDYVKNIITNSFHGTCDEKYYKKALEILTEKIKEKNIELFVFSDDINWVKENLSFTYPSNFVSTEQIPDYEELYLMSLCKHNILANSSFSWWGAWLNKNNAKIVIAPQQWFKNIKADEISILPPTWLQI